MTTYIANIITADSGLGDPAVGITTQADESGSADLIIEYPLPDDTSWSDLLHEHGWIVDGDPENAGGYDIVNVRPVDLIDLVQEITHARAQAQAELDRQDNAWRTVIRDAMHEGSTNKTRIAEAAGVDRTRAYQIRDGRRT